MNDNEIFERASEWLIVMDDPSLQDRIEFLKWVLRSPRHVHAYLRARRDHGRLRKIIHDHHFDTSSSDQPATVQPVEPRYPAWKIAAGIAVLAVIVATFQYVSDGTVRTEAGEWHTTRLVDGTVVQAGPRTELVAKFTDEQRIVRLVRGEAMFRVAPNHARPFLVVTNQATARAVGTAFAVSLLYDEGPLVTVEEGTVEVTRHTQSRADGQSVMLRAGQQVQVTATSLKVENVNVHDALAWVRGSLVFGTGAVVADAVREYNFRNRVQIEIAEGSTIARQAVRGGFAAGDPNAFVEFLERRGTVSVVREDADILLLVPYRAPNK